MAEVCDLQSTLLVYSEILLNMSQCEKATIYQLTTILATSKIILFLGHNHPANHRY